MIQKKTTTENKRVLVCPLFRAAEIIAYKGSPSADMVRNEDDDGEPYDPIQNLPILIQRCIREKCALWCADSCGFRQ
jgi:hypothetical protein